MSEILLSLIDPDPNQPRKYFDQAKLEELAQSIKANGLAVPILLRPNGERFIIVHGERRYKAAQFLEWESIPAEVRDISPDEAKWLSLAENIQRSDLSPIEEAQTYKSHLETGITQEELANRVGKGRTYITQKLRLLKLPSKIQKAIDQGELSEGHARQLLRIENAFSRKNELQNRLHQAFCEVVSQCFCNKVDVSSLQEQVYQEAILNDFSVQRTKLEVDARLLLDVPSTLGFSDLVKFEQDAETNGLKEYQIRAQKKLGRLLEISKRWWEDEDMPWLVQWLFEEKCLADIEAVIEIEADLKKDGYGLLDTITLAKVPSSLISKWTEEYTAKGEEITQGIYFELAREYVSRDTSGVRS